MRFELEVADRRSSDSHIDAIVRKRSLDFRRLLEALRREELQAACEALQVGRHSCRCHSRPSHSARLRLLAVTRVAHVPTVGTMSNAEAARLIFCCRSAMQCGREDGSGVGLRRGTKRKRRGRAIAGSGRSASSLRATLWWPGWLESSGLEPPVRRGRSLVRRELRLERGALGWRLAERVQAASLPPRTGRDFSRDRRARGGGTLSATEAALTGRRAEALASAGATVGVVRVQIAATAVADDRTG
jgi:hypothetical protein